MNRLKHCEEYQDHTLEKIIFSDESFFREFYASDYCWSGNGQIVQKEMKSTYNYGCVLVFGSISYEGKSKLWIIPKSTTITAEIYQQDNATSHTAKVTKRWFEDHQIKLFPHPPCSPDLNPIEMLWGIMKQALTNDKKHYNLELLIERLIELWNDINQSLVNKLIDHTKCVYKECPYSLHNQAINTRRPKKNEEKDKITGYTYAMASLITMTLQEYLIKESLMNKEEKMNVEDFKKLIMNTFQKGVKDAYKMNHIIQINKDEKSPIFAAINIAKDNVSKFTKKN
ncbi:hypothetical protein ABPG72_020036 [Tetrahymena utriculariae]